jgi:hypothetical protein
VRTGHQSNISALPDHAAFVKWRAVIADRDGAFNAVKPAMLKKNNGIIILDARD